MDLEQWKQSGNYFHYQSKFHVFYKEAASKKEILLLLHGFPTASWDWHKIWLPLAKHFHLIAPDFMGYGFSDKPKRYNYSVHGQASLIEGLLAEKKIEKCHVISHDFGDTVMQELLARQLERNLNDEKGVEYKSICLLNGGLFPEMHKPRPIQKALISPFGILITPFLNKRKLKNNFHSIFGKATPPNDQEIDAFFSLISNNNGKYLFHKLIRYMTERKLYRERWVAALQNCKVPLLLINGNADPISGKHMSNHFKKLIPNGKVIDIPNIGHYPQIETPEKTVKFFLDFQNR